MRIDHTVESALRVFWRNSRGAFVPMTASELEEVGIDRSLRSSLATRKCIEMKRLSRSNKDCIWSVTAHGAELFASGRAELSEVALQRAGCHAKRQAVKKWAALLSHISTKPMCNADLSVAAGLTQGTVSRGVRDMCAAGLVKRRALPMRPEVFSPRAVITITKAGLEWLAKHEAGCLPLSTDGGAK